MLENMFRYWNWGEKTHNFKCDPACLLKLCLHGSQLIRKVLIKHSGIEFEKQSHPWLIAYLPECQKMCLLHYFTKNTRFPSILNLWSIFHTQVYVFLKLFFLFWILNCLKKRKNIWKVLVHMSEIFQFRNLILMWLVLILFLSQSVLIQKYCIGLRKKYSRRFMSISCLLCWQLIFLF